MERRVRPTGPANEEPAVLRRWSLLRCESLGSLPGSDAHARRARARWAARRWDGGATAAACWARRPPHLRHLSRAHIGAWAGAAEAHPDALPAHRGGPARHDAGCHRHPRRRHDPGLRGRAQRVVAAGRGRRERTPDCRARGVRRGGQPETLRHAPRYLRAGNLHRGPHDLTQRADRRLRLARRPVRAAVRGGRDYVYIPSVETGVLSATGAALQNKLDDFRATLLLGVRSASARSSVA